VRQCSAGWPGAGLVLGRRQLHGGNSLADRKLSLEDALGMDDITQTSPTEVVQRHSGQVVA
jgi:hypothetical protein